MPLMSLRHPSPFSPRVGNLTYTPLARDVLRETEAKDTKRTPEIHSRDLRLNAVLPSKFVA